MGVGKTSSGNMRGHSSAGDPASVVVAICYLQNGERAPSVTVAYRILDVLGVDPATGWGALFIAAAIPDVGKDRHAEAEEHRER